MSHQPGLCSFSGCLLAAWKDKPSELSIGPGGTNDGISYAVYNGESWQILGTLPGVTSIGVSLAADYQDSNGDTVEAVYAAWKGAGEDIQGYFSVFSPGDANENFFPATYAWQIQTAVENAGCPSGPSIACLQSDDGPSAVIYLWAGYAVGQTGPFGEFTVWYYATAIAFGTDLTVFFGTPLPVPNVASGNAIQVAVAKQETLYMIWFDNNTKRWSCQLGALVVNPTLQLTLSWSDLMLLPNYANAAGYSMTNYDFGPDTPHPIYVTWMDEQNRIFGSSFDNLVTSGAGTPIPGASGQATTLMGCSLAEVGSIMYAVWADLSGQLCYASTSDAKNWNYLGIIPGAVSGADVSHRFGPIHLPPTRSSL